MKALGSLVLISWLAVLVFPGDSPATVNNVVARNDYNGDDNTKIFTYTFRILDKTQIEVIDVALATGVETVKTVDTDYTVAGIGAASGTITFTVAPASTHKVVFLRKQPIQQSSDYLLNEGFPSDRVETDLDKQAMIDQQQDEAIGRAIKLPKRSTITNLYLPAPDKCDTTNRFVAWKTDFTALECATATGVQGPPGPAGGYSTISDEGASLTQRNSVNFTGSGVSCVDNAGASRTDCTVSGGGASTDVQIFTTTGANTWTKPGGTPKHTCAVLVGGGGGGQGGKRGASSSNRPGGSAGAGGGWSDGCWPTSLLGATETVNVGAGGPGGAGASSDNNMGGNGTDGGDSSFGAWLKAKGGQRGSLGVGGAGVFDGGTGGNGSDVGSGGSAAAVGVQSKKGASGGGGGGEVDSSNVGQSSAVGGPAASLRNTVIPGGTAGSSGATCTAGGNASNTATNEAIGGAGGGGGGGRISGGAGCNGGNGGLYGGGGGGGGASINGQTSGAGGTGGNGIVIIVTVF